jgi:hypothetical protein
MTEPTFYTLLPEDLKRETAKFLHHQKYKQVITDLEQYTSLVKFHLDDPELYIPECCSYYVCITAVTPTHATLSLRLLHNFHDDDKHLYSGDVWFYKTLADAKQCVRRLFKFNPDIQITVP